MTKYKPLAVLILSLFLLVCAKTKNPVNNPSSPQFQVFQTDCKGSFKPGTEWSRQAGTVIFSSHGDTIFVTHQDAFYNCCSEIKVNVTDTPNGFDLLEYDVGDACHCMCYFDITTTISDLAPGTYLIRYFDIDSNLVDSGFVDVPPKYAGSESSQGECRGDFYKTNGNASLSNLEDSLLIWVNADTIFVTHENAYYNCCSKITVSTVPTPQGFDLYEHDEGDICDCMCSFDITTTIYGLSPGTYLIRYFDIDSSLVDSEFVDVPPVYTGSESYQGQCKPELYKAKGEAALGDLEDTVLAWYHADTAWVMHKNAWENCASLIRTKIERTPEGFDLYEYDISTDRAYCTCYFDIITTIYGLSPGVYLIRVFDTVGDLVGQVELIIPPSSGV